MFRKSRQRRRFTSASVRQLAPDSPQVCAASPPEEAAPVVGVDQFSGLRLLMARALPISEVKAHLPELVVAVQEREEEIVVTRKGHPAAVIINVDEYARLRETLDILGDPRLLSQVRAGRSYFRRGGKGVPLDDALSSGRPPKKAPRRKR